MIKRFLFILILASCTITYGMEERYVEKGERNLTTKVYNISLGRSLRPEEHTSYRKKQRSSKSDGEAMNSIPCHLINSEKFYLPEDFTSEDKVAIEAGKYQLLADADNFERSEIIKKVKSEKEKEGELGDKFVPVAYSGDRRAHVNNSLKPVFRVHGRLKISFPDKKKYYGTGVLVGPRHVLTAAYNVYHFKNKGWATDISFIPGLNDRVYPKTLKAKGQTLLCFKGWTNGKGNNKQENYNLGMIILDEDVGNIVGWAGLYAAPKGVLKNLKVNITGFPGEKSGHQMWSMCGNIYKVKPDCMWYDIDTTSGQGGGGLWFSSPYEELENMYVLGVHASGSTKGEEGNKGILITLKKFQTILGWLAVGNYTPTPKKLCWPPTLAEKDIEELIVKANKKARANYELGCYFHEVERNNLKALEYFKKAASLNNKYRLNYISFCLFNYEGEDKAIIQKEIFHALKKDKENRDAFAYQILGRVYMEGLRELNLNPNFIKALKYYKRAKKQIAGDGKGTIYNSLGVIFHDGRAGIQNYKKALKFYRIAQSQGSSDASRNLGYMYYYGEGVKQDYKLALEWFAHASRQGYKDRFMLNAVNETYAHDLRMNKIEKASIVDFMVPEGPQDSVTLQRNLGRIYYYGLYGKKKDQEKALSYFKAAKDAAYIPSSNLIFSQKGGICTDFPRIVDVYTKICENYLRNFIQEKQADPKTILHYIFSLHKLHYLSVVKFQGNTFVPFLDENRYVWIFSQDQEKWLRILPCKPEVNEWLVSSNKLSFSISNPIKLRNLNDNRLCCIYIDSASSLRISSSKNGVDWEKGERITLSDVDDDTLNLQNLCVTAINKKIYLFCLNEALNKIMVSSFPEVFMNEDSKDRNLSKLVWDQIEDLDPSEAMDVSVFNNSFYCAYHDSNQGELKIATININNINEVTMVKNFKILNKSKTITFLSLKKGIHLAHTDNKGVMFYTFSKDGQQWSELSEDPYSEHCFDVSELHAGQEAKADGEKETGDDKESNEPKNRCVLS